MKITVLAENTTNRPELEAEHGLSLLIETEDRLILFDMGQSDLFIKNAEKLGLNLRDVDIAVISHGHYDHGGGLKAFLALNSTAPVYINRHAFGPHYNGTEKYIGLDTSLSHNPRLIFTDDVFEIDKNLSLFTCNDMKKDFDLGSFNLNIMDGDKFIPDNFCHEHYLLIKESHQKTLISGCSHKGIMDITNHFKPDILVGGFHFSKLPLNDTLKYYSETLRNFGTRLYTCHCTGADQYKFMKNYIPSLSYISTGDVLEI